MALRSTRTRLESVGPRAPTLLVRGGPATVVGINHCCVRQLTFYLSLVAVLGLEPRLGRLYHRRMAHATNIRAFRDCNSAEPFFRLYTLLVAIELALKDVCTPHVGGHDLHRIVQRAFPAVSAGLSAQLTTLQRTLGILVCTDLRGSRSSVDPTKYPDLRYLRHEVDYPGDSKPTDILDALDAARQVVRELKTAGVNL